MVSLRDYWDKSLGDRITPEGFTVNEHKWFLLKKLMPKYNLDGLSKLELGCGTCRWAIQYKWDNYTGIDISDVGIDYCRQALPDAELHNINCETFKSDKKYDVIIGMDSMEHIPLTMRLAKMLRSVSHDTTFFLGNIPLLNFTGHPKGVEHDISYGLLANFMCLAGFPFIESQCYYIPGVHKKGTVQLPFLLFKAKKALW